MYLSSVGRESPRRGFMSKDGRYPDVVGNIHEGMDKAIFAFIFIIF
jgi:hypothetical protein